MEAHPDAAIDIRDALREIEAAEAAWMTGVGILDPTDPSAPVVARELSHATASGVRSAQSSKS